MKNNLNPITVADFILTAAVIFLGVIAVYPFIYVLSLSLSENVAVLAGQVYLLPKGFNLEAYKMVVTDRRIIVGFTNSVIYTVTGTVVSVFMTMLTAYPLADSKLRYRRILMRIIIVTMLFGGGLIPTYMLIRNLRWINTIWAIIIPGCVSAWNLIIARTFIEQLPGDIFDAAEIDGCSQMRLFIQIVLPLSAPIVATLALWAAVGHWNSYFTPMLYLNSENKKPLQVFLQQLVLAAQAIQSERGQDILSGRIPMVPETLKAAILVISSIPILIVYPFIQKYFVKGILIGAIKG